MSKLNLKQTIVSLPNAPGVYIMKDAEGKIIYIGKAKSLKKRVQTYFARALDAKTQVLVSKIANIEYKTTPTEAQALVLESSLVKEHLPQYNIDLKDDKSFPWVRITREDFPIVSVIRRKKISLQDDALYFGPYTDATLLRQAIKFLREVFGFRTCKKMPRKMCLYGRIKLCPSPCEGKITKGDYKLILANIELALEGRADDLVKRLSSQMQEASRREDFEEAVKFRDQIIALSSMEPAGVTAGSQKELEDLKLALKLSKLPVRIEAFDISNIYGQEATGSMVSFYRGLPDKDNYRKFRIKTIDKIDDYAMLKEVVRRRYQRIIEEKLPLPDLVLIDGGKGHLLSAEKELKNLKLDLDLISIAKERENIYSAKLDKPVRLKEGRPSLNLIRRVRDEAHRFAVSYHHVLRRKKIIGK